MLRETIGSSRLATIRREVERARRELSFAKTTAGVKWLIVGCHLQIYPRLDDHAHSACFGSSLSLLGGSRQLALENLALRQQLGVYSEPSSDPPYTELIGSSGSCSPESGRDGGGL